MPNERACARRIIIIFRFRPQATHAHGSSALLPPLCSQPHARFLDWLSTISIDDDATNQILQRIMITHSFTDFFRCRCDKHITTASKPAIQKEVEDARRARARAHINFDTNRIRAGFCNRFLVSYEFISCTHSARSTLSPAYVSMGTRCSLLTSHLLCNSNIYFVFSNFVSNLCFGGMRSRSMRLYIRLLQNSMCAPHQPNRC